MKSFWDIPFVVIDVETTGSGPENNRVTDIACITVLGGEIISEYKSLVNPHMPIPEYIQTMTGISDKMVVDAPEPEEIFPEVYKILSQPDCVFVAHNVQFDWGFIKNTLKMCGFDPPVLPKVCTLKLARKLIGKETKKNVGALSEYFGIELKDRHRAYGDASATAKILVNLLELAEQDLGLTTIDDLVAMQAKAGKHNNVPLKTLRRVNPILDNLPHEPGVYYFLGMQKEILYVGKAKYLNERVRSYFRSGNVHTKKISDLLKKIFDIRWETTDTELGALLLESKEIKKHKPYFNTVDKIYKKYPLIKLTSNEIFPRAEMCFEIADDGAEYFGPFRSITLVEDMVKTIEKQFVLRKCTNPIKADSVKKPCFYFHIKKCLSPCSSAVTPDEYKEELEKVRLYLSGFTDGIIKQFENQMMISAEELDFERAEIFKNQIKELKRLLERRQNVPTSINKNNFILIQPASKRDKTIEVFFIRAGKLSHQETIGRKAPLDKFNGLIKELYFNGFDESLKYSFEDIDELKIINSWAFRKQESGVFLYTEGKEFNEIITDFETSIRNVSYPEEIDENAQV